MNNSSRTTTPMNNSNRLSSSSQLPLSFPSGLASSALVSSVVLSGTAGGASVGGAGGASSFFSSSVFSSSGFSSTLESSADLANLPAFFLKKLKLFLNESFFLMFVALDSFFFSSSVLSSVSVSLLSPSPFSSPPSFVSSSLVSSFVSSLMISLISSLVSSTLASPFPSFSSITTLVSSLEVMSATTPFFGVEEISTDLLEVMFPIFINLYSNSK